jgi:hypothetical protein
MLATLGIIFFSIFQSEAIGILFFGSAELVRIVCGPLIWAGCYFIVRILWYGALSSKAISAPLHMGDINYLTRVDYGVQDMVRSTPPGSFLWLLATGPEKEGWLEIFKKEHKVRAIPVRSKIWVTWFIFCLIWMFWWGVPLRPAPDLWVIFAVLTNGAFIVTMFFVCRLWALSYEQAYDHHRQVLVNQGRFEYAQNGIDKARDVKSITE